MSIPEPTTPIGKGTQTSRFGVGRRENHDASAFYDQFVAPVISDDEEIRSCATRDQLLVGDARDMSAVASKSVALVVTSPPYFAGKDYEAALGTGHVPGSYVEYLKMLADVFDECSRVLEPGGRIAVNVANLGRKPYRSLAGDVTRILQDHLGLLLRGELVWIKGAGANGSCAWGSYASAANPVLRDVTERVVVACKGRFGRALSRPKRRERGLPWENSITPEQFRAWTLDTWRIAPERATRVGHPAPFPVELPRRLIELFTYVGDVVVDPFVGSAQTAIACLRTGRHYVGFDTDADYVALGERRVAAEKQQLAAPPAG
ncbi:MAG: site-specific DNA-methyltransferase [Actinomycetota bacterium]|nr:site-specific DNA-methyltransferase [Actinomycetota bacterium]MDQ6948756.1 site-specific DNA-methyltransferase [Actinomycetota bacterium]